MRLIRPHERRRVSWNTVAFMVEGISRINSCDLRPAYLMIENVDNTKALLDYVKEKTLPSTVRDERSIDRILDRSGKNHVILDLPGIEIYSEIETYVAKGANVKPVRDWSRIAKGVEEDSTLRWRGYVFARPGKRSIDQPNRFFEPISAKGKVLV